MGIAASNQISLTSGGAAATVTGVAGAALTVAVLSPTTTASIDDNATVTAGTITPPSSNSSSTQVGTVASNDPTSGSLPTISIGDVTVTASNDETMVGAGAGVAIGGAAGGSLGVYTISAGTSATIGDASVTATGNVAVTANSTSEADFVEGGVAAGGFVGAALGVDVISNTTTAGIGGGAQVTAYALGNAYSYTSGYSASYGSYLSTDAATGADLSSKLSGANTSSGDPTTTSDITQMGENLLLEKRSVAPITSTGSGVIVNAANSDTTRSVDVSGALGAATLTLSGDVPAISSTVSATIGANAQIDQNETALVAPGSSQSVAVNASNNVYAMGVGGSVAGGAAAGGAGFVADVVNSTTTAEIGSGAKVAATDDVSVLASAQEAFAGMSASVQLGGVASFSGAVGVLTVNDQTKAQIDGNATVAAGNNVEVVADDSTQSAIFSGAAAVSAGAGVGGSLGIVLVTKDTEANILSGAKVTADAGVSGDTFEEYTGADFTTVTSGQGLLVQANSNESVFTADVAGSVGGVGIGAAGTLSLQIVNTTTVAAIAGGAWINPDNTNPSGQDVSVVARDSTGIVATDGAVSGALTGGFAGSLDIGVIASDVNASIGGTVNAGGNVTVAALENRPISSTVVSGSIGGVSIAAAISDYSIGNGIDPSSKGGSEIDLGSNNGAAGYANSEASRGSDLSSIIASVTSNTDAMNAGKTASADVDGLNITSALVSPAVQAGVTATISGTVAATGSVNVDAADTVGTSTLAGALSVGGAAGLGAGVIVDTVATSTEANIANATVTAGSLNVNGTATRTYGAQAFAGSAAIGLAAEADVAIITDTSHVSTTVGSSNIYVTGAASVTDSLSRTLSNAQATSGALAGGVAVGVSLVTAEFDGGASVSFTNATITGQSGNWAGAITVGATDTDTANATTTAAAGGIGIAASGSVATVTIDPTVSATISGGELATSGEMSITSASTYRGSAIANGVSVAGGFAIGASLATATGAASVSTNVTSAALIGGDITISSTVTEPSALDAEAYGTSGGILLGVTATKAYADNTPSAMTSVSGGSIDAFGSGFNGSTFATNGNISITAANTTSDSATAKGASYGFVAAGAVLATADADTVTSATSNAQVLSHQLHTEVASTSGGLPTDYYSASYVLVSAIGNDTENASATAGSGGGFAGNGAVAATHDIAKVTTTVGTEIGLAATPAGSIDIVAQHYDNFTESSDSSGAGVVEISAALATHDAESTVALNVNAGTTLAATSYDDQTCNGNGCTPSINLDAYNSFESGAINVKAGSGGGIAGAGATSTVNLNVGTSSGNTNDTRINVGNNVNMTSGENVNPNPGSIAIVAHSNIGESATVSLTADGAIAGAGVVSDLNAKLDNYTNIGSNDYIYTPGAVDIATWTNSSTGDSSGVSTGGLAAVGSADAHETFTNVESVAIGSSTTINAFGDIALTAGYYEGHGDFSEFNASSSAVGFVRGFIAVPAASASTTVTSNQTLVIGSGDQVTSGANVTLGGYKPETNLSASGVGHGYELGFIPVTDGDSSKSITGSANAIVDGTVVAGAYHDLELTIDTNGNVNQSSGAAVSYATSSNYDPNSFTANSGLSTTSAISLGQLYAAGGFVKVNADTLSGYGSVTAYGSPVINVVNNSSDLLLLSGGAYIPYAVGGDVIFTGAAGQSNAGGISFNAVGANGTPAISIHNTGFSLVGNDAGTPIYIGGDITNLGGSVTITNDWGDIAETGSIGSLQTNMYAPHGSLTVYSPNSPSGWSAGGSVIAEWQNAVTYPGGNPYTSTTLDTTQFINYVASGSYLPGGVPANAAVGFLESLGLDAKVYNTTAQNPDIVEFIGYCVGWRGGCGGSGYDLYANRGQDTFEGDDGYQSGGKMPYLTYYGTQNLAPLANEVTGGSAQIYGGSVSVTANIIDINAYVSAGAQTNYNLTIGSQQINYYNGSSKLISENYLNYLQNIYPNQVLDVSYLAGYAPGILTFNTGTGTISVAPIRAFSGGGNVLLHGQIISSSTSGQINVNSGYGQVNITNDSAYALDLSEISTGTNTAANFSTGEVVIWDTLKDATTNWDTTTYVFQSSGGVTSYVTQNGADPLKPGTSVLSTATSSGSSVTYSPVQGTRYNWELLADATRTVSFNGNNNTASSSAWTFSTGTRNDPWLYVDQYGNTYAASSPQGWLTTGNSSLENKQFVEKYFGQLWQ